jgi:hypothetical protein
MSAACPVCGFDGLRAPPYHPPGCASFEICPCCGTQFGYDDTGRTHAELRRSWVEAGAGWWSDATRPPAGWSGREQLRRAGLAEE